MITAIIVALITATPAFFMALVSWRQVRPAGKGAPRMADSVLASRRDLREILRRLDRLEKRVFH